MRGSIATGAPGAPRGPRLAVAPEDGDDAAVRADPGARKATGLCMTDSGIDTAGIRFGPFWLAPGISKANALTLFYATFANVLMITFLNFLQPYLLNDVIGVAPERQGVLTGTLNLVQELVALALFGVVGAASDRMGRRNLCAAGLVLQAIGLALIPMAGAELQLYLVRLVFAAGVATASVTILAAFQDYPQEVSRGKWSGANSIATSIGILLLSLVGVRLPGFYQEAGADPAMAGRLAFWTAAAIALVSAAIIRTGFHGGVAAAPGTRPSLLAGVGAAVRAAAGNPRLALSYFCAFASRGDMMVLGAFLSLWFIRAGAEEGLESTAALARVGIALGVFQLALMIGAPLVGWLVDRISRVLAVCLAMAVNAVAYFAVGSVDNPYDFAVMLPAIALLGLGEIGAIITGNTLLGQEAPPRLRGAASGAYNFCGTLGVLFATGLGGLAFDRLGYGVPFTMMACVNALVMLAAGVTFVRSGRR
jgi:MFS family permease